MTAYLDLSIPPGSCFADSGIPLHFGSSGQTQCLQISLENNQNQIFNFLDL